MTTRIWPILTSVCMTACCLFAQQGRVEGPNAGFVFDSGSRALRPVHGIPGAALIGDPLDFGIDVASVAVAPRQDAAFVIAGDGSLHYFRLASGSATEQPSDAFTGSPERVIFSPSGTAVALYAAGRVQVITGLPDAPALAGTLDVAQPGALAITDDAAYVMAGLSGSIVLLGLGGVNQKLLDAGEGTMIAFAPGSSNAAILDGSGTLSVFRDPAGSQDRAVLASGDDAIAGPAGVAFSADASKVFAADSSTNAVWSFDLQASSRVSISCVCSPATLVRMGNVFRLNELATDPLWLLEPMAAEPRTVFVPALPPPSGN